MGFLLGLPLKLLALVFGLLRVLIPVLLLILVMILLLIIFTDVHVAEINRDIKQAGHRELFHHETINGRTI